MNTPSPAEVEEARAVVARDDTRKLMRGFGGFQMATALVVSAKSSEVQAAAWIIALFAISIPSTVVVGFFPRFTDNDRNRNPGGVALLAGTFAFVPSFTALTILLWPAAGFATLIFPTVTLFWVLVIVVLRGRQAHSQKQNR